MRNIELKARCPDLARARSIARSIDATHENVLLQTDTYFTVPHGRLKLREIESSHSELIWYDRPNAASARSSDYTLYPISDPTTFKAMLTGALSAWCIVRKRRDLYRWKNVRIHLDEVDRLGSFIEFEAVLSQTETESEACHRLAWLREQFGIHQSDLVPDSYSDLLGRQG